MKPLTTLILLGAAGAVIYAVAKQREAPEGGDTFEPDVGPPPDLPDLPEGEFDPNVRQPPLARFDPNVGG